MPGRPTPPSERKPPAGRLAHLWKAPHRIAFLAAAVLLAGTALGWVAVLLLQAQGVPVAWAVPRGIVHGLLMGYGFMPLFFAGFLFTAGPKWLRQAPVAASSLRWPVLAYAGGWLLFLCGAMSGLALAAAGMSLSLFAWGLLTLRFMRLLGRSKADDKQHAAWVAAACAAGCGVLALALLGLLLHRQPLLRAALHGGLWCFVTLVFVVVSHRIVPFYGAAALPGLLQTQGCIVVVQGALSAAELLWPAWPAAARWAQAAFELAVALLLLGLAVRWARVQSLRVRLIAMLHLGFVWLGVAFALAALSHALMAITQGALSLGLAPLHALTMGFLGSTMLAMVTRMSCALERRTVAADTFAWRLFWLLQGAVLLRLGAALLPGPGLLPMAALAWAGCMTAWALRYGRWYVRAAPPTVDPGQGARTPAR